MFNFPNLWWQCPQSPANSSTKIRMYQHSQVLFIICQLLSAPSFLNNLSALQWLQKLARCYQLVLYVNSILRQRFFSLLTYHGSFVHFYSATELHALTKTFWNSGMFSMMQWQHANMCVFGMFSSCWQLFQRYQLPKQRKTFAKHFSWAHFIRRSKLVPNCPMHWQKQQPSIRSIYHTRCSWIGERKNIVHRTDKFHENTMNR